MKSIFQIVYNRLIILTRFLYAVSLLVNNESRHNYKIGLLSRINALRKGFTSDSYVLYKKIDLYPLNNYLSDFTRRYKLNYINGKYGILLADKLLTYKQLSPLDHYLPKLFFVFRHGTIWKPKMGNLLEVGLIDSVFETLEENTKLIIKPSTGFGGRNIHILEYNKIENNIKLDNLVLTKDQLIKTISSLNGEFLVTEFINQNGYANKIYPGSVNTIRIITIYQEGKFWIAGLAHRFGTKSSGFVDNWTNGGISTKINIETGELGQSALQLGGTNYFEWISHHPDTGEKIAGKHIPNWTELLSKIKDLSIMCYNCPLIGWDIAVSNNRFYIVEANNSPDIHVVQMHNPLLNKADNKNFFLNYKTL